MGIFWGIVLITLGMICWVGQVISWLAPSTAVRIGVMEAEADVEEAFWADVRGEALWDSLTLWSLPVAGALLVVGAASWAYFGMVGGSVYAYFAGRGILTRLAMKKRGLRIGETSQIPVVLASLVVWGIVGGITVVAAVRALVS